MPGAPSTYHTLWSYLWDLEADGLEEAVDVVRNEIGLHGISVATAYHTFQQLRPHRQGRKLMISNTAALYFKPDLSLYGDTRIRPHVAQSALDSNPFERLANCCSATGLDLISWTVCLHNSHLAASYPRSAQQTAYGDNLGWMLCPGDDDVRAYVIAVCVDLVRNYGVRRLELETCNFGGYGHAHFHVKDGVEMGEIGRYLYSLSFSPGCMDRARQAGIDIEGLRSWVVELLDEVFATGRPLEADGGEGGRGIESFVAAHDDLAAFQELREDIVASLLAEIKEASGVGELSFMLMGDRWTAGIRPTKVGAAADLLEILAYTSSPDEVQRRIEGVAANGFDDPSRLVVGLQDYPPAASSAEELSANVARAEECGIRQFSHYNYGIMPRPNLQWIRRCIHEGSGRRESG